MIKKRKEYSRLQFSCHSWFRSSSWRMCDSTTRRKSWWTSRPAWRCRRPRRRGAEEFPAPSWPRRRHSWGCRCVSSVASPTSWRYPVDARGSARWSPDRFAMILCKITCIYRYLVCKIVQSVGKYQVSRDCILVGVPRKPRKVAQDRAHTSFIVRLIYYLHVRKIVLYEVYIGKRSIKVDNFLSIDWYLSRLNIERTVFVLHLFLRKFQDKKNEECTAGDVLSPSTWTSYCFPRYILAPRRTHTQAYCVGQVFHNILSEMQNCFFNIFLHSLY